MPLRRYGVFTPSTESVVRGLRLARFLSFAQKEFEKEFEICRAHTIVNWTLLSMMPAEMA